MAGDTKERTFQRFIEPLREWGKRLTTANTTPDAVLDGNEVAAMAVQESLTNPKMNLSPAKLQAYTSQAVSFRAELDAASNAVSTNDPRTQLLQSIVRDRQGVKMVEGRPIAETEALLRSDLQKFAKEAGQTLADGGSAIAREVAQGMLALNGVQTIIKQNTRFTESILNENREQLPFAQRDLRNATAEEARIDARIKEQNASRVTPQQMLADIRKQAAARGETLPPEAESAFLKMMQQAMGPEGQAQSATALAAGIDKMKAELTKSGAVGDAPSQMGKAQNDVIEKMRAAVEADIQRRGLEPNSKEAQQMLASIKAYETAVAGSSKQLPPQANNSILIGMLDSAKTSILQTPEQEAAEYREGKTGFTKEQLADIVKAREVLGSISNVQEPTLQQFSQAVQQAASKGR